MKAWAEVTYLCGDTDRWQIEGTPDQIHAAMERAEQAGHIGGVPIEGITITPVLGPGDYVLLAIGAGWFASFLWMLYQLATTTN